MKLIFLLVLILNSGVAWAEGIPKDVVAWWQSNAPLCKAPDGFEFPGKIANGTCDDGDINLFAGLLCLSGEKLGCETVKRAFDPATGKWSRSPRRAQTNNLGSPDSFSPDMALGTQLYVAATNDRERFRLWLAWLDDHRPCWIGSGDSCVKAPLVRFCTDDSERGCTARPGDLADLDATSTKLGTLPPSKDVQNLFHQAGLNRMDLIWASAQLNNPGYSQHLTAVEVLLLRRLGYSDDRLKAAAETLAKKQPRNPFFLYLAEGATQRVADLTISVCPKKETGLPKEQNEWSWERSDDQKAWMNSMLWDCIFMANMINGVKK